jgi:(5-formylfuran-3-yl)methyl phosphate synthase
MTRLLASVTSLDEAEVALGLGADIIDLKDPSRGALGGLPVGVIRSIVGQVAGRRPLSATVGDLPADPDLLGRAVQAVGDTGVDYVKVGLFSTENLEDFLLAMSRLARRHALIAVLFADRAPPLERLERFAAGGIKGIMLDTADKTGGSLLTHLSLARLEQFLSGARSLSLLSGLAGSLRLGDIPLLLPLSPDYLGFRGALCRGTKRTLRLDPDRFGAVRRAVDTPSHQIPSTHTGSRGATAGLRCAPPDHRDSLESQALTDPDFSGGSLAERRPSRQPSPPSESIPASEGGTA